MVYIVNLLLVPLYYGLFWLLLPKRTAERWFMWTFTAHAILFRALAYPFDFSDAPTYARAYQDISHLDFHHAVIADNRYTEWGRGYVALNWLLSHLSRDYMLLFITLSFITVGGTMWFYARTSYSMLLTAMLYLLNPMLYVMSFTALRQHLAAVVILMALYHLKNYRISIPLGVLAALCHTSAIVFLPFFVWRKLNFRRLHSVEMLVLIAIAVVAMRMMIGYLMNITGLLSSGRNANFADQSDGTNIVPVVILGIPMALAFAGRLFQKIRGVDYEILNFMAYGFAVTLFGIGFYGAGRLSIYFIYVLPAIVTFYNRYSYSLHKVNNFCIALLFVLTMRQVYYVQSSWIRNYDYKFYWEIPMR